MSTPPRPTTEEGRAEPPAYSHSCIQGIEPCAACAFADGMTYMIERRALAPAPVPALDVERLLRALKALHGDNVPLYARQVRTTPEEYVAKIIEMDRLATRPVEEEPK